MQRKINNGYQRLSTFSECFKLIFQCYGTFSISVGEQCKHFRMHLKCFCIHFNMSKWVALKNGSTQISLSPAGFPKDGHKQQS